MDILDTLFLHVCSSYYPASILYKSIAGRYRPVKVADGSITTRYRFIKNAYWEAWAKQLKYCINMAGRLCRNDFVLCRSDCALC